MTAETVKMNEEPTPDAALGSPEVLASRLVNAIPSENRWGERIGPIYTAARLTEILNISRQAISDRTKTRSLWGLKTADGHVVYPARQFTRNFEVLPGLSDVLRVFKGVPVDDWTLASWLVARQPDLSRKSILDWLEGDTRRDMQLPLLLAKRTAHRWSH